ncbi:MAG: carbohydrate ABC transporter substrate-binding protein, partial [Spirochaetaceae bacterium]|nr:carbohydrate ABC transporter substrate-binding protein [Spirochaetaceae bacterium]
MRNLPINLSALPLAAVLAGALCVTCAKPKQAQSTETIRLTMGSWRADDVAHVTKLLAEYKKIQP